MEIPEISMISDFEAGMKCLQNPSIISRLFSFSGIEKVPQAYSFWKWGAVILALVATFSGIINKIKLIIRVRRVKSSASGSEKYLLDELTNEFDLTDDDESASTSPEIQELERMSPFEEKSPADEDFLVAGSSYFQDNQWQNGNLKLRRRRISDENYRFSWSDFAAGKSVVKLWDSLGLGFDFEDSYEGSVSVLDLSRGVKISSIFAEKRRIPAVGTASQAVVLSAEVNEREGVVLGAYDTRVGRQIPAVYAEWRPWKGGGKVVGVNSGGVEKVYLKEAGTGAVTVGDLRNVRTPLETVTASDSNTWWDADAVIVSNELVDDL